MLISDVGGRAFGNCIWPTSAVYSGPPLWLMFWGRGFWFRPYIKEQSRKLWECGNRVVLRDFQGLRKGWEARGWLSMLSSARHFHSYLISSEAFPPFFCLFIVRRNR